MAPDTAYHFLRREAEDISQLETLSVEDEGTEGKKGVWHYLPFSFNTGIHCKIDISLYGNLLPDTVLVFSREKHFFPFPLIANSQSDCWIENSLKLPLVYPKAQKWIVKWVHFKWIRCHLLVFLSWSNSAPWTVEFEAFGFLPPCCKSGKGQSLWWGHLSKFTYWRNYNIRNKAKVPWLLHPYKGFVMEWKEGDILQN